MCLNVERNILAQSVNRQGPLYFGNGSSDAPLGFEVLNILGKIEVRQGRCFQCDQIPFRLVANLYSRIAQLLDQRLWIILWSNGRSEAKKKSVPHTCQTI